MIRNILEVSATEKITIVPLQDDEKLLGDDKRNCDACKQNGAEDKVIR